MRLGKKQEAQLEKIKARIRDSYGYFDDNVKRYHEFTNFVFRTSLSSTEIDKLMVLQKPAIEFNILEAMVSRLRGEFSRHEPTIDIRAADGVPIERMTPQFVATIEVLQAHLREIFFDNREQSYRIYTDLLAGGYSVVEIYTEYSNDYSFEHKINVERAFDPTLCGFDPMARASSKFDGAYCFKMIPKTKQEFEEEFGTAATKGVKFNRTSAEFKEFQWFYKNQDQDVVMVVEYFEKKKNKIKICKLSNGMTIEKKEYEKFIDLWQRNNVFEQAPIIINERWTHKEQIDRYILCGEQILEHSITDYKYLPLVFIDGNSLVLRSSDYSASQQMTRPYVYHAKGIQQLKNFSGQTLAAEIENIVQHKFLAAKEGIPDDDEFSSAYTDVQQPNVLVYNAFDTNNPDKALPPPREIERVPPPPIVERTFGEADGATQAILGSYDAILGVSDKQISGVAIQQGALHSNASAIPYLMGYINGITHIATVLLDLIPKYYVTPRSIPLRDTDGRRYYKVINSEDVPDGEFPLFMQYDSNDLSVKIEAGPSVSVQKQVALDQITRMMQSSPVFSEFINTKGLEIIIDNLDIRGNDRLKLAALEFMKEQEQRKLQAAQQEDPTIAVAQQDIQSRLMAKEMDIAVQKQKIQDENRIKLADLAIKKEKNNIEALKILAQLRQENRQLREKVFQERSEDIRDVFHDATEALKEEDFAK